MRMKSLLVAAAAAVTTSMLAMASPAHADGAVDGGSNGNGYNLQAVDVVVKGGPGDPVPSGNFKVSVPPKCWWSAMDNHMGMSYFVDYMNRKAKEEGGPDAPPYDVDNPNMMADYWDYLTSVTNGSFAFVRAQYPSDAYVMKILKEEAAGRPHTWYQVQSQPKVNCVDEGFIDKKGTYPPEYHADWDTGSYGVAYQAFPNGTPPPPPLVDVEDVVEEVWDFAAQQLGGPELDRNPKIQGAGGSTLVNLPTWFWVQNVREALADDGEIHLEVSIPGTNVAATLDATTEGLQVTSPAGATQCSVEQAKTAWSALFNDDSACTIGFSRANRDGWPVTASVTWTGTWEGTQQNGERVGGALQTLTPSTTTNVPVAESQALVNRVQ